MTTNSYRISPTHPGSTVGLGYHQLSDYATGPVLHPAPSWQPTGQTASFAAGLADASIGQQHHMLRRVVTGYIVGRVVGHGIARMRQR
jgi:hypothetical protein